MLRLFLTQLQGQLRQLLLISVFYTPQPDTSRSCKTTDTALLQHVVCQFTPQLSLIFITH